MLDCTTCAAIRAACYASASRRPAMGVRQADLYQRRAVAGGHFGPASRQAPSLRRSLGAGNAAEAAQCNDEGAFFGRKPDPAEGYATLRRVIAGRFQQGSCDGHCSARQSIGSLKRCASRMQACGACKAFGGLDCVALRSDRHCLDRDLRGFGTRLFPNAGARGNRRIDLRFRISGGVLLCWAQIFHLRLGRCAPVRIAAVLGADEWRAGGRMAIACGAERLFRFSPRPYLFCSPAFLSPR